MTPQQLRDLQAWVEQYAAGVDELDERAAAAIVAAYAGVNFYSRAAVDEAAEQAADMSNTAALMMAGLAAQYVATTTSLITDQELPTPAVLLPPLRRGADMRRVFARPAKTFRRLVAQGKTPDEALAQAMRLAGMLAETNNRLAGREAASQSMNRLADAARITGFRRIVHPELSRTGACGLCIVASDQVYARNKLLPMHERCKCTVLPVIGEAGGASDPGNSLNGMSLGDFYALAAARPNAQRRSGTAREDLSKVRVQVREHGEYGPTLTNAGQRFLSWEDLGLAAPGAA